MTTPSSDGGCFARVETVQKLQESLNELNKKLSLVVNEPKHVALVAEVSKLNDFLERKYSGLEVRLNQLGVGGIDLKNDLRELQASVQTRFADVDDKLAVTVTTPKLQNVIDDVGKLRAEVGGNCVSVCTDISHLRESFDTRIEELVSKLDAEVCGLQESMDEVVGMTGNIAVTIPDFGDSVRFTQLVDRVESLQRSCDEGHLQFTTAVKVDGAEQGMSKVGLASTSNNNVLSDVIHKNLQDIFEERLPDITRKFEVRIEEFYSKLDTEVSHLQDSLEEVVEMDRFTELVRRVEYLQRSCDESHEQITITMNNSPLQRSCDGTQDNFEARLADIPRKFEVSIETLSPKLDADVLQDCLEEVGEMAGDNSSGLLGIGDSDSITELVSCVESLQRSCDEAHEQFTIAVKVDGAEQGTKNVGSLCESNNNVVSEVIYKSLQDHFEAHLSDITRKSEVRVEELSSKLDAEVCGLQDSLDEIVDIADVIYKTLQDRFEARFASLQDSLVEVVGNNDVEIVDFGDSNRFDDAQ